MYMEKAIPVLLKVILPELEIFYVNRPCNTKIAAGIRVRKITSNLGQQLRERAKMEKGRFDTQSRMGEVGR